MGWGVHLTVFKIQKWVGVVHSGHACSFVTWLDSAFFLWGLGIRSTKLSYISGIEWSIIFFTIDCDMLKEKWSKVKIRKSFYNLPFEHTKHCTQIWFNGFCSFSLCFGEFLFKNTVCLRNIIGTDLFKLLTSWSCVCTAWTVSQWRWWLHHRIR